MNDAYPLIVVVCGRCGWELVKLPSVPSPRDPLSLLDKAGCRHCLTEFTAIGAPLVELAAIERNA